MKKGHIQKNEEFSEVRFETLVLRITWVGNIVRELLRITTYSVDATRPIAVKFFARRDMFPCTIANPNSDVTLKCKFPYPSNPCQGYNASDHAGGF